VGAAPDRSMKPQPMLGSEGKWDRSRAVSSFDPAAGELVHESQRSRVTRLSLDGRMVIRKEPLGPDGERALSHEVAMLKRLRGVVGVAQLVESPRHPGSIVMTDAGDRTLVEVAKPLAVDDLTGLAQALAEAVGEMHRRGVMHRNISPGNVVISADGAPCLVGFRLATSLAEIRPEFTHHADIVGTLAYMAPEQTGRTGRAVDQRADLYALGAVLYELATGAPPFGFADPLRLTHDHLARVPTPPAEANPAVPAALSEIIMHLLEKEPDRRYQAAESVVDDLERLRARPGASTSRVGEHDIPLRLLPPSRLVGRDVEIAMLKAAFAEAVTGRCRGVLVGGAAGVGKTALVDELRPVVTSAEGLFVAGKFDQYRRDLAFDALHQALRALGRLLLAEPESELAAARERILGAVGANAPLLTATVPEFATLLGVPPGAGDPLTAQDRTERSAAAALRAIASPERPLVVFLDDLQWAGRTSLGVIELLLAEEPVDGLLLVGAYRDGDVDAAHPLAAPLTRWRREAGVRHLRLTELSASDLVTMVAEMLHADRPAAAALAQLLEPHTRGNPYETVEVLNALRRAGVLAATAGEWRWEADAVNVHLGEPGTGRAAGERVEALPATARELTEAMACLGGRAELSLMQVATDEPADVVEERLSPALDDGLLVLEPVPRPALRFGHDRMREAILRRLDPSRRRTLQIAMARRLARVPELFAAAAEQYLPVVDAIGDPQERRVVVGLLRRAAEQAALVGDYQLVNALSAAALPLVDATDHATVVEVRTRRHAALFGLGRLDEADDEYRAIEALCSTPLQCADATAVQVRSLTHRTRFAEAMELGLASLSECGVTVPAGHELAAELDRQFDRLHRWLDGSDATDDLVRPPLDDATLLATSRLIDAVLPTTYFVAEPALIAWLGLEALRIWIDHGPGPTLVGPIGHAAYHAGPQRGEHALGYRALRRIVALGESRGYEPGTSQARHMLAAMTGWYEPIENGVHTAQRAREGLIAGGDLAYAGYTYQLAVPYLADCAPSLERLLAEIDGGLAFLRRTGNEQTGQWLDSYRWLARALRGESSTAASEAIPIDQYADNPLALLYAHLCRAVVAAIFDDPDSLAHDSAAAMSLLPAAAGFYSIAVVRLLRGLALAAQARTAEADQRDGLLSELDEVTRWLSARAADAPDNFLHLVRLLEAERAWAVGDFRAGVFAFDAARTAVARRQRPWHGALIAERAARFHLVHGLEQAGSALLAEARREYLDWGAIAKVDRLDWAYPALRADAGAATQGPFTTGTIDLLGILSASQALSSETSVERLHRRVVEVLGAMTGATGVHLVLWSEERQDWLLPAADVPMSVLRYTQRMGEPLVVADATRDDRFARDPYFRDADGSSLLAVPVVSRGMLRAVLLLENRLIRGAFSADRLDVVKLIAGQLAVSLDNAQLYAELAASRKRLLAAGDEARRRIERDLHDGAQQRLVHTVVALKLARKALGGAAGGAAELVADALENAERGMEEVRELARGIHPRILSTSGLGAALKAIAGRSPIPVTLDVQADVRLVEHVEVTAYYVISEALTNAVKYSNARSVHLAAVVRDAALRLSISDDGVGGADPSRGSGLVGLKDRVEAVGGSLMVQSPVGEGTRLLVELPLDPAGRA
jgi:signal transduction histidine kinase